MGMDEKPVDGSWWAKAGTLPQLAVVIVIMAGVWFMLKELAVLLRPLLLAILLCYVIMPVHSRLRKERSELTTLTIMTGWAVAILFALSILVYGNLVALSEQLPRLIQRAKDLTAASEQWNGTHLPEWLNREVNDVLLLESKYEQMIQTAAPASVKYTADVVIEALVVGLYTIFLLLEARRIQRRVHGGFESGRAVQILSTVQRINDSIASYLKAKVKASAVLAASVTAVLLVFGVHFAALWGLLTFFCNFIPYVGSVIAGGAPLLFGFLDLPPGWQPVTVAALLFGCHTASASFVEPTLIGKAVGLSPLFILIALTFWGLCWGIVGMFLAVPLTVTLKIVLSNIESTRPIATLLGDD